MNKLRINPLHPTASRGFTLIEVVIAMAIFAILSALAYSGLQSVIDSKSHTEAGLERLQAVQMSMLTLSNDLQQIAPRAAQDALGGNLHKLSTQSSEYLVEFTRSGWRNPAESPRSSLQRVAYKLDEDRLIRIYWSHVDRADEERRVERVLIDNIESLQLRFLNEQQEWTEDWPEAAVLTSSNESPVPLAIEATLDTHDWGEITRLLRVGY
ncbi:MAG TPA: type II secretion system minor pseudopilin GspJ [Gammaproteobacteria bacterium]